ncbi:MAG TPA: VOC family protein [Vicinamibacterales bacterium]|jgi:predicted enzyme related to lactoylglutathione lyase
MGQPRVSAVLFAKDYVSLTGFYVEAMGLALREERHDDHAVLVCEGFSLVIHQIPADIAAVVKIDRPPRRREDATIKLCFAVDSLERVRRSAAALGGIVDGPDTEWTDEESITCKGHDPEGNVFNVFVYRERR